MIGLNSNMIAIKSEFDLSQLKTKASLQITRRNHRLSLLANTKSPTISL